jgi:hypothetical protein
MTLVSGVEQAAHGGRLVWHRRKPASARRKGDGAPLTKRREQ